MGFPPAYRARGRGSRTEVGAEDGPPGDEVILSPTLPAHRRLSVSMA
jgi:hypothetical protein